MANIQDYKFRKVMKELFTCTDELQAQLAETRIQCKQIQEVMIAIRENKMTAKNHILPKCPCGRDKAAND
jgi:hypothetical protein